VHVAVASPVALQTLPHVPQFEVSLPRSTQEPEQFSRPRSQVSPSSQAPAVQMASPLQAALQAPQ
jgi:hypothetical protein